MLCLLKGSLRHEIWELEDEVCNILQKKQTNKHQVVDRFVTYLLISFKKEKKCD